MADNVAITAGSGTSVATDDVSGNHYQKVKLGVGVADSAVMLGHLEDDAHSSGDGGMFILSVRKDSAASTAGTDGDYAALTTDSTGRLHCNVSNTLTVASHAVTNAGTFTVQAEQVGTWNVAVTSTVLQKAIDTATGATDTGVIMLATRDDALSSLTPVEGDNVQLRTDANGALWVIPSGTITVAAHAVTNAGTFVVQENGGALTALQIMDDWDNGASDGASVSGDVAHDTADAGEPVKTGAKAVANLFSQTMVTANDRANSVCDLDGAQIVRLHCSLADIVSGVASNTDGAATDVIAASGDAAIKTYLTSVTLINTSATAIYVDIRSGTTVKWRFPVPPNSFGVTHTFNPPLPPNGANETWNMDGSAAATTLYGSFVGFKSKV